MAKNPAVGDAIGVDVADSPFKSTSMMSPLRERFAWSSCPIVRARALNEETKPEFDVPSTD